jgi:hypothetical protein
MQDDDMITTQKKQKKMLCLSVVISGVYLQEELDSPLDR